MEYLPGGDVMVSCSLAVLDIFVLRNCLFECQRHQHDLILWADATYLRCYVTSKGP